MAILPIIKFPDVRLRTAAEPIVIFDKALRDLADDLLAAMRAAPGIGATASHVGVLKRLVVIELPGAASASVYVNPEVAWASDETAEGVEGSISMPGVTEQVERSVCVRVRFQDLAGSPHEEAADGLLARCLLHEIDQLNGVFWIRRLSRLKRERLIKRYEKLVR